MKNKNGISESDQIGFSIGGLFNPPTTQTTDSIQIRIVNSNDYSSVNQKMKGVTITTIDAYPISNASIRPGSFEPGVATKYIFDFYPEHSISAPGGFMITVPS